MKLPIVITGGIATGKSSVCKLLKNSGYEIVCADEIAHEALDDSADEIAKIFGPQFVVGGRVDRGALGGVVFGDAEAKQRVEELLHPIIRERIEREAKRLLAQNMQFVVDIPLFFETGGYEADTVAVVYAPRQTQLERLMLRDGMSESAAQKRLASQGDIEQKRLAADFVIDNSGDMAQLKKQIELFLKFLKDKDADPKIYG